MKTNKQQPVIDMESVEGMREQLGDTFTHVVMMHFEVNDHSPEQYAKLDTILGTLCDFHTTLLSIRQQWKEVEHG